MRRALAAAILTVLATGPARADALDERIAAAPGGSLEVDLDWGEGLRPDRGQLRVSSHVADEVRILADTSGWGGYGVKFHLDRQGSTVRLVGRVGGVMSWLFGGPRIEVQLWVPREFSLDLRAYGAPIFIDDTSGPVRARTRDGSIEVVGVEGPVKLRTTGGDLRVSEVSGDVDARTSLGRIEVSWVAGDVELRTGDGQIRVERVDGRLDARSDRGRIELLDVTGPVQAKTERGGVYASFVGDPAGSLETRRGSVEVALPRDAGAELDARSRRGSVDVAADFELGGGVESDHAIGRLNAGGAPLRLYTARGGVRVRAR